MFTELWQLYTHMFALELMNKQGEWLSDFKQLGKTLRLIMGFKKQYFKVGILSENISEGFFASLKLF